MPAGLVIFNAAGSIVLDQTTRVGRVLGVGATGYVDGSITPAGSDTGTLFVLPFSILLQGADLYVPVFTVTATTISWHFNYLDEGEHINNPVDFLYGVY